MTGQRSEHAAGAFPLLLFILKKEGNESIIIRYKKMIRGLSILLRTVKADMGSVKSAMVKNPSASLQHPKRRQTGGNLALFYCLGVRKAMNSPVIQSPKELVGPAGFGLKVVLIPLLNCHFSEVFSSRNDRE